MVESAPVLSSLFPLENGSGGKNISDAKCSTAAWSWRWEETLAVPGVEVACTKSEKEREAGDEGDEREGRLTDPLATTVHNDNEGFRASSRKNGITNNLDTPSSEAIPTGVVVVPGDDAADYLRVDDGNPSACEVGTIVDPKGSSTDSSESRQVSAAMIGEQPTDGGPAVVEAASPKAVDGAKKKRGVSFWSPRRRGRRSNDVTAGDKQSSGVCTSHYDIEAVSTTLDGAVITGDKRWGNNESSSDSRTSGSDKQENSIQDAREFRGVNPVRSLSSGQGCPDDLAKVDDTAVVAEGEVGEGANKKANGGVTIKRAVSFWGPRRGRRSRTSDTAIDEQSSQATSKCDSEASTAFDISNPEDNGDGAAANKTKEDPGQADQSSIVSILSDTPHNKRTGVSFWSPRRKGNRGAKGAEIDNNHARSSSGAATMTGHRPPAELTEHASNSRGQRGKRRRRVPSKASTTSDDVILLEVWEVKVAATLSPGPKKEAVITGTECGDGKLRVGSLHTPGSKKEKNSCIHVPPLDGMEEASNQLGPAEESLSAHSYTQPLGAVVDKTGDPRPEFDGSLEIPASESRGIGNGALATERGCVDTDGLPGVGDGISSVADDEASVASTTSTKNARGKRTILFLSSRKGRRNKGEKTSKLSSPGPLIGSSETGNPRGSLSTDDGNDSEEEGGQQESDIPFESSERETSKASLDSRISNVPEESSTDDEDGDGDASTAKRASRRQKTTTLLSSYKDRKRAKDSSPRPAAKAKPVLWGRLTMHVGDVLLAARGRIAGGDDRLEEGQNVPSGSTDGTKSVASSDCAPVQSPVLKNGGRSPSSVSGTSLAPRGPKKHTNGQLATLGPTSSGGHQVDRTASGLQPQTAAVTSAVEGWFEIEHPKRKQGQQAKGRLHLTMTCHEPPAPSDAKSQAASINT